MNDKQLRDMHQAAGLIREYPRAAPNTPAARLMKLVSEAREQYLAELKDGGEPVYPDWTNDVEAVLFPTAPAAGDAQSAAARDVLAERQRQISAEGFSTERDDGYTNLELADAGAQYALRAGGWSSLNVWPWKPDTFKEGTPREMLVKAGALILAEIERLDRAALSAQPTTKERT